MARDHVRRLCSQTRPHRSAHCLALWLCAQLLLSRYCHGSQEHLDGLFDAQKVPQHQVHSGSDVHLVLGQRQLLQGNTGNTGGIRLSRHRARAHSRHLRASTAAKAAANGSPNVAILPYPREASAVRRYLADAMQSSNAPHTIPVWFVVVVDPSNTAATNVTEEQLRSQIYLLNSAYRAGLPQPDAIIQESGSYTASSGASIHPSSTKALVKSNTVQIKDTPAASTKVHARRGSGNAVAADEKQQQGAQQVVTHRQLAAANVNSRSGTELWRFELRGVKYVSSSDPMCVGSSTELQLKKTWRPQLTQEGNTTPDRTLIIYVSQMSSDKCKGRVPGYSVLFGYGTSPYDLVMWKQHKQEYRDGVVIDPGYLLNNKVQKESGQGAARGTASGAQLVHEVGHWMGLQHTFEGGCTTDGTKTDQVDDTPAEALPKQWGVSLKDASAGCAYRDSCGGLVGPDMYYNYMTYMNLACARTFTAGQQARMLYMFKAVREH